MTVVAVWVDRSGDILCAADARVSGPGGGVLTDSAPKILPLIVRTHRTTPGAEKWELLESRSFGFAFAGSTLAAHSAFALASAMTSMVALNEGRTTFPELASIAEIVRYASELYIRELGEGGKFTACVFGFETGEGAPKAIEISPVVVGGVFTMQASPLAIEADKEPFIFGSGETRLRAKMAEIAALSPAPFIRVVPNMIDALWKLVKDEQGDGVGGYIQLATINEDGFGYITILEQEDPRSDKFKVKLLGHPVPSLPEDDVRIGTRGIAPDWLGFDKVFRQRGEAPI